MDEDSLNMEIRRFLKTVGITSQREIEKQIQDLEKKGNININEEIDLEMVLKSKKLNFSHKIEGKIILKK